MSSLATQAITKQTLWYLMHIASGLNKSHVWQSGACGISLWASIYQQSLARQASQTEISYAMFPCLLNSGLDQSSYATSKTKVQVAQWPSCNFHYFFCWALRLAPLLMRTGQLGCYSMLWYHCAYSVCQYCHSVKTNHKSTCTVVLGLGYLYIH